MEEFTFRTASNSDSGRIWEILVQAKEQMYREGRHQWDESYPTPETVASDISAGYGYVLCGEGEKVIAYGAVVFDGEKAYNQIDGRWLSPMPYVVVHRLAVADEMKKRGIARRFMEKVEELARSKGLLSFKIDTNFDNAYMLRLLSNCGFTRCGIIRYDKGERIAFEKIIG